MVRTFSLLGMVVFAAGVVALASLSRRAQLAPVAAQPREGSRRPDYSPRRLIPAFAFESPFSLN
jgi:hypothetical protein